LVSQISKEDDFNTLLDPQSIINVLLNAFPDYKENFGIIWNEIAQNSVLYSIDYPMESLKSRLNDINDQMLPFYR